MTATTATDTAARNTWLAINAYTDLSKGFARHMAWQNACRVYSIREALGETYNPAPKGMPSKAAKHQMYADAGRVISALGLDVKRPSTLAEIADVIAAATARLMER